MDVDTIADVGEAAASALPVRTPPEAAAGVFASPDVALRPTRMISSSVGPDVASVAAEVVLVVASVASSLVACNVCASRPASWAARCMSAGETNTPRYGADEYPYRRWSSHVRPPTLLDARNWEPTWTIRAKGAAHSCAAAEFLRGAATRRIEINEGRKDEDPTAAGSHRGHRVWVLTQQPTWF
jgi:hypothetical protein